MVDTEEDGVDLEAMADMVEEWEGVMEAVRWGEALVEVEGVVVELLTELLL